MKLQCQACSGVMVKKTISSGNLTGILLGLVVFCVGVVLCFTLVGAIIGIPLCLLALCMGGKTQKVWRCKACKTVLPRA